VSRADCNNNVVDTLFRHSQHALDCTGSASRESLFLLKLGSLETRTPLRESLVELAWSDLITAQLVMSQSTVLSAFATREFERTNVTNEE
jgi:hypothetical protein